MKIILLIIVLLNVACSFKALNLMHAIKLNVFDAKINQPKY